MPTGLLIKPPRDSGRFQYACRIKLCHKPSTLTRQEAATAGSTLPARGTGPVSSSPCTQWPAWAGHRLPVALLRRPHLHAHRHQQFSVAAKRKLVSEALTSGVMGLRSNMDNRAGWYKGWNAVHAEEQSRPSHSPTKHFSQLFTAMLSSCGVRAYFAPMSAPSSGTAYVSLKYTTGSNVVLLVLAQSKAPAKLQATTQRPAQNTADLSTRQAHMRSPYPTLNTYKLCACKMQHGLLRSNTPVGHLTTIAGSKAVTAEQSSLERLGCWHLRHHNISAIDVHTSYLQHNACTLGPITGSTAQLASCNLSCNKGCSGFPAKFVCSRTARWLRWCWD